MIVSHNSMTFLEPSNPLMNVFSKFWRCQELNLEEQKKKGVKALDIRVYHKNNGWYVAHGAVSFGRIGDKLTDIAKFVKDNGFHYYRIILERCEVYSDYERFIAEFEPIKESTDTECKCIYAAVKKHPITHEWMMTYIAYDECGIEKGYDLCFKDWSVKNIFKTLFTKYDPIREGSGEPEPEDSDKVIIYKDFV